MKDYTKIFEGSLVMAQKISAALEEKNITPVIKNETESARLAGFAPPIIDNVQLFVFKDEFAVAQQILTTVVNDTNK